MNAMVVGVLALASAVVRERGEMIHDWPSRTAEAYSLALPRIVDGEVGPETTSTAARPPGDAESSSDLAVTSSDASSPSGQWQIACEIKSGSVLVFDRGSLREYGAVTLVRWSAPRTRLAAPGDQIFTAVVNCREKSIEAAWPGRNRETRAGTCGRGLVEAVCAASGQAAAIEKARGVIERAPARAVDARSPRR